MADTLIFKKDDLITWLQNNIGSEIVCVASVNNVGVSVNTKAGTRKETFIFASGVVKKGRSAHKFNGVSILLMKQDDVSEETLNFYNAE